MLSTSWAHGLPAGMNNALFVSEAKDLAGPEGYHEILRLRQILRLWLRR
jgi:hypothetical protein